MAKRRRQNATSNAAQARRENRRKLAMIADWQAHGVTPATVPSGNGTTPTGTSGAGPTPSEAGGLAGAVGTTGTLQVDTDRTGLVGGVENFLEALPQYLKIAAGGLGLIVTGLALVYVAGRNTPVGQVASAATNVVPAGRVAKAAQGVASGRKALAAEKTAHAATRSTAREKSAKNLAARRDANRKAREARSEARFYRTAYGNTAEAREGAASARRTKVLPRIEAPKGGSGKAYR